jgi:hypothetical protein
MNSRTAVALGSLPLTSITPGAADQTYAKLKIRSDGSKRLRSAILSIVMTGHLCVIRWSIIVVPRSIS